VGRTLLSDAFGVGVGRDHPAVAFWRLAPRVVHTSSQLFHRISSLDTLDSPFIRFIVGVEFLVLDWDIDLSNHFLELSRDAER
jgi:hypothetical protein